MNTPTLSYWLSANIFKKLSLFLILFIVVQFSARAQNWERVGDNENNQASFTYINSASIVKSPDNKLYLPFIDGLTHMASVRRYNGSAWEQVGQPAVSDTVVNIVSLAFDDNIPYLVYAGNKFVVKKFDGTNWVTVLTDQLTNGADMLSISIVNSVPYVLYRSSDSHHTLFFKKFENGTFTTIATSNVMSGANNAYYYSIAFDGSTPYIAFKDYVTGGRSYVKKLTGTQWTDVGSYSELAASDIMQLKINNGVPYLALWNNGTNPCVKYFNGRQWTFLGSPEVSSTSVIKMTLGFDNDTPYLIAQSGYPNYKVFLNKYENGNWLAFNSEFDAVVDPKTSFLSLEFVNNMPYAFSLDQNIGYGKLRRYNGSGWELLESKGFSLGNTAGVLDIKSDKNNVPYVLYLDYTSSYRTTLARYNGSGWETVGAPGFSVNNSNVYAAAIGFGADNNPIVTYTGGGENQQKIYLSRYNGTSWQSDNNATLVLSNNAYGIVLAFDGSVPYTLFNHIDLEGKLNLKKYDGQTWNNIGTSGFSDKESLGAEIKFFNHIPYVAYHTDHSSKLSVMRFADEQWLKIGNTINTQYNASYISMAFDNAGTPYLAHTGMENTKLSVWKLNDSTWAKQGTEFNASRHVEKPSLFISQANQPIVSFRDANVNGRASSYKFNGTNWTLIGSAGISAYEAMPYTFVYNNKLHAVYSINKLYHKFYNGDFIEARPVTPARDVKVNTLLANEAGISWKNGSGAARAVFVSTYDSGTVTLPDGVEYIANVEYGVGSKAQNSSWYCVYNGTDTTVTVKKLSLGTHYKVAVFEYNGSGAEIKYTSPVVSMTKDFTTLARPITIAQGQWTWASGTEGFHSNGSPGVKGVSAPSNEPKARFGSMNWKDKNGDFWVMGGYGLYDFGQRNDLWKYTIQTGEWTWMSGEVTVNPGASYGTKGLASASNVPGGRQDALTWTDANGDLWLFGGFGFTTPDKIGYLNDLWKYSIATGLWTWVGGSNQINQYATYGSKGMANVGNYPGSRRQSVTWVDTNGDFWLMGGAGYAVTGTFGELNDLWKYNSLTNQWTWMSGNNVIYSKGIYGTKGVPSADNYPGGRADAVGWTDNQGNLWLMGGIGYLSTKDGLGNDLWKYNIATNQWTWMSGGNIGGEVSNYGTQGVPSASNVPGSRYQANAWTDDSGNFWLMGGSGHNQYGILDNYNEMWVYSPTTNMWTWIDGSTYQGQRGVYGTKGQAAPANRPGTRRDALTWTDGNNNFWLFGGAGMGGMGTGNAESGTLNDLWVYQPPQLSWIKPALTSLTPDKGKLSPGFSADSINYTVKLPLGSKAIRFTPTASNNAIIKIQNNIIQSGSLSDSIALTSGDNIIPVVVSIGNESLSYKVTVKVGRYAPQLTFAATTAKNYGDASFNPGATSENMVTPIAYTSSNSQIAQIVNGQVRILKNGSVRITASQPAGNGFNAAMPVTQVITINKATLTVKAKNKSRVYGVANGSLAFIYTGFVNGDNATKLTGGAPVASVNANTASPVGNYDIIPIVKPSDYYELVTEPGVLTITKAPLTVTTVAATRFYGAANPVIVFKYTGFVNNDGASKLTIKPMATIEADQLSIPGKYVVTVDGGLAQNYELSYVPGTITINKANLFITAKSRTITYGESFPAPALTYSGFVNGEKAEQAFTTMPVITTTAASTSSAGNYPITVSGGVSSKYVLYYNKGTFTINKAVLQVTARNQTREQYQTNPEFTLRYSGFVNGDTETMLRTIPMGTTSAIPNSPVGQYAINVSGGYSPYYTFNYISGVLTVTKSTSPSLTRTATVTDEILVHTAVSPNGDGLNDYWLIENIEKYTDNQVMILTSAGKLVYQAKGYDNYNQRFDGYSSGSKIRQQPGTYMYVIDYMANGEQKKKTGYLVIK